MPGLCEDGGEQRAADALVGVQLSPWGGWRAEAPEHAAQPGTISMASLLWDLTGCSW